MVLDFIYNSDDLVVPHHFPHPNFRHPLHHLSAIIMVISIGLRKLSELIHFNPIRIGLTVFIISVVAVIAVTAVMGVMAVMVVMVVVAVIAVITNIIVAIINLTIVMAIIDMT